MLSRTKLVDRLVPGLVIGVLAFLRSLSGTGAKVDHYERIRHTLMLRQPNDMLTGLERV